MKKVYFTLLVLSLLIVLFAGCDLSNGPLVCDYDLSGGPYMVDNMKEDDVCLQIDNESVYDCAITQTVSIHRFAQTFGKNVVGGGSIKEIAADMGIECLRTTPQGALYSVHKVEQGGLLYLFYHTADETNIADTTMMSWFYVCDNLSYSDYTDEIIEGKSTMDDVIALDASEQIFQNYYLADRENWNQEGAFYSWHYLADGILHIRYRVDKDNLIVDSMVLQNDFQLTDPDEGMSHPYCARLLEGDFLIV